MYGLSNINFSFNTINQKFTIHNRNTDFDISAVFYDPDLSTDACQSQIDGFGKVGGGGKIDYNLGWLLGFRLQSQSIKAGDYIKARAVLNNTGPKYFFVVLEDYNNNRPNYDLISYGGNPTEFKLPTYFNKQTMSNSYNDRGCSENALNPDLRSNLTEAQVYTIEQIKLSQQQSNINRYYAPNPSDILTRVELKPRFELVDGNYLFRCDVSLPNNSANIPHRKYFGPVKLSKFNIRLLTDKGYQVNLEGEDWSVAIQATALYNPPGII